MFMNASSTLCQLDTLQIVMNGSKLFGSHLLSSPMLFQRSADGNDVECVLFQQIAFKVFGHTVAPSIGPGCITISIFSFSTIPCSNHPVI